MPKIKPEELKASILQYAIEGKLVEQRAEEGTAEELYKQIQSEKNKLIKEGKIKKEKPLDEITEDEIPFDIPESWKWVHLNNIATSCLGKTLNKTTDTGEEVPYLCSINVYFEGVNLDKIKTAKFDLQEKEKYRLQKGDLLICEGGEAGRSAIWDSDDEMYYQNALHRVRFFGNISARYMCFVLECYKKNGTIEDYTKGIGIKHLVQSSLNSIWLPLPPLAEQHRIVAKIEELLPYVDRYAEAYDRLEEFNAKFPEEMKKSVLQYAIEGRLVEQRAEEGTAEELYKQIRADKQKLIKEGKIKKEKPLPEISEDEIPFDIPESWKWVRLGKVIKEVIVPQRDKPPFSTTGIPWCRIEDRDGWLLNGSKSNQLVSDETIKEMNLKVIPIGSVLSACTGGSIGTIVINTVECCTNQTFNALVCSSGVYNWYLFYFLTTRFYELRRVGTGTTIAYISQQKSKEMVFPLPPLAEQRRIVAKIEELLPLCERLAECREKA